MAQLAYKMVFILGWPELLMRVLLMSAFFLEGTSRGDLKDKKIGFAEHSMSSSPHSPSSPFCPGK